MRKSFDVSTFCSNQQDMDYCRHFDRIKSVLEYCDGNVKQLQKILFRGGNEKVIGEIIEQFEEVVKELNYSGGEQDLRKIAFFLILNTDVTYKYDLKTDQKICHVLNVTPQLTKCLLVSIIWDLKLDKFFYETLSYTPSWFAFQFIESAIASMKYLEPYDVLAKVENLLVSICTNICRADLRVENDVDKKILLNKFYDSTMELLRQFYTPDTEKFADWSKRKFYKYSGFAIRHLLKMVMFCFNSIEFPLQPKIEEHLRVYEICKECSIPNDKKDAGYSDIVLEMLQKILMSLLNSLQYNVMLVTLDVFMYWAEFDVTAELSLQADIGDHAYQVLERMAANKQFGHDVQQQLQFITIRRKTLAESIAEANIGDILQKLEPTTAIDNKERKLWLDELLNRPVIFGNDECLETIELNVKLLSLGNCMHILENIQSDENADSKMDGEDDDLSLRKIVIKALYNFNCDQIAELITHEIRIFGQNTEFFKRDDLEQRCTEFFNKSTENFDTKTFLQLCFEHPEFVWKKFFNEAYVSHQQAKNLCATSVRVRKLSKLFFQRLLDESFSSNYDEKSYPHLLFEIHEANILEKGVFFKQFIYKNVMEMLDAQHYIPLLTILKAMSMIVHKTQSVLPFGSLTAPVLIMIGQIMDQCRWDLVSYSVLNDEIVRLSIDCIQATTKSFLPVANERDKKWINDKVKSYRPITQYYFQKYSLSLDEQPKTFDEFLQTEPLTDRSAITKFLISVYVRCTMKETEWLAKSVTLRPHISDMILFLESLVGELGENAIKNFRHSIINYANIVKKFLLADVENDNEKITNLGFKILKIISMSPKVLYDELFLSFQGILLDVFQKLRPISEEIIGDVRKCVSEMTDCKGKEIFHEKFQAMAMENLS